MNSLDRERQHQEDLQRIRGFRLIDDDFMNACLDEDITAAELMLRIILGKHHLQVKNVKAQKLMKSLSGRDIWLDVYAIDDDGTEYNIEIQRADKGADRKRARFHSSMLDAGALMPKEYFDKLPDTYVIFITENDVIGKGKPLYRIERTIVDTDELFGDGEHIVYVNGADRNSGTELGRLMHDFFCTDADDMHYKELADKVRYYKENEKGVASMCKVMEDMRLETAKMAIDDRNTEMAMDMIKDGKMPLELISQYSKLSLDRVKELATLGQNNLNNDQ